MSLPNLLATIESEEYQANFTVISGFKTLLRGLEADEVVKAAVSEVTEHADSKREILSRIKRLLQSSNEPELLHPHDIPVTVLLFILFKVDGQAAVEAAELISSTANLWWANRLAAYVNEKLATDKTIITKSVQERSSSTFRRN